MRSKTKLADNAFAGVGISIHLLHAEQDYASSCDYDSLKEFQSTCSMRSKTLKELLDMGAITISIHLLHAEQDVF